MLSRGNRVTTADEFRAVVRRGRRVSTCAGVYYFLPADALAPARFGFIVSRAVGSAVTRNLLRRRLRAVARELVDSGMLGRDIVIRPLPAAPRLSFGELRADVVSALAPRRVPA
ncbi:MAG: ribonuclease P protein component [Micrococcales bacterium]|nr:ribonuclease P protein component [Micrococcales bacterium]